MYIFNRRQFVAAVISSGAGGIFTPCPVRGSTGLYRDHSPDQGDPTFLGRLRSPILLRGGPTSAYRDPAAIFYNGYYYLFFTHVEIEHGVPLLTVGMRKSVDLYEWSPLVELTPRDVHLNYSSPGSVVWDGHKWVMCLQSYPRPKGEKYGNDEARLYTMSSADLETWSIPTVLMVKGPGVPISAMGRMIDPCLFRDNANPFGWWCVYKQHGLSFSWSENLESWRYIRSTHGAENPCVLSDGDSYLMMDSPSNGLEIQRSTDLISWKKKSKTTLGQAEWRWAHGRLTAGFLLDQRNDPNVRRWLLFFHGSQFHENDPRGGFDNYASIGCAWSDNLIDWRWPDTSTA